MKDFEIRYGDTMFFYFRMVSNAAFDRTVNRLESTRRNTQMFTISRVEMTRCLYNICSIALATFITINHIA